METEPEPEPPKSAEETAVPQHRGQGSSRPKSECNGYWVKYPENGSKIKQHELWIKGCFGSNQALRPQKYHTGCKYFNGITEYIKNIYRNRKYQAYETNMEFTMSASNQK